MPDILDVLMWIPLLIPEALRPWLMILGIISLIISIVSGKIIGAGISTFLLYLGMGLLS